MTENSPVGIEQRPDWLPSAPLTYASVRAHLEAIVDFQPEGHAYVRPESPGENGPGCYYWHAEKSEPGCIIGQLLHRLGVPGDVLGSYDVLRNIPSAIDSVAKVHLKGMFDDTTVKCLRHLQVQQDGGATWREALERMDSYRQGLRAAAVMVRKMLFPIE